MSLTAKKLGATKARWTFLLCCLLVSPKVWASPFAWVALDTDARSAALGGCGVALDLGADSSSLNPALLSGLMGPDLTAMHNQWFDDASFEHFSAGLALAKGFGGAVLVDIANLGKVQGYRVGSDGYVYTSDVLQPKGLRFGGALGKSFGDLAFGASLSRVSQKGFGDDSSSLCWCVGTAYRLDRRPLTVGFSVLGASGDSDVEFRPGFSTSFGDPLRSSVLGTGEVAFGGENPGATVKVGMEYAYTGKYFVRGGYRLYNDSAILGGFRGLTAGVGFRTGRVAFDYALSTLGDLGQGHQFSLRWFTPEKPKDLKPKTRSKTAAKVAIEEKKVPSDQPAPAAMEKKDEAKTSNETGMMEVYQAGMKAYKAKQYALAIRQLKKAVVIKEEGVKDFYYAEAYATLGILYHHHRTSDGHLEKAKQYYLKALKIDPDTDNAKKGLKELEKE
jgi:hypothetical protein